MSEKGKQLSATHNGKMRIEYQNNRIILDGEDGLAQLLIGLRNDGELAVDAAPPGTDVLTAEDIDLSFSSRFRSFKIADVGTAQIEPFDIPAHSTVTGTAQATYESSSIDSPIVLAFTDSLAVSGFYLWHGVSPESTMSSPSSAPMGYNVFIRFDTFVSLTEIDPLYEFTISFNATVRNATASDINDTNYAIKYYVLVETASTT